jgi:hypothetical protein
MAQQMTLPGVIRPQTKADMKAEIAYKLHGLELRQAARKAKRDKRNARRRIYG